MCHHRRRLQVARPRPQHRLGGRDFLLGVGERQLEQVVLKLGGQPRRGGLEYGHQRFAMQRSQMPHQRAQHRRAVPRRAPVGELLRQFADQFGVAPFLLDTLGASQRFSREILRPRLRDIVATRELDQRQRAVVRLQSMGLLDQRFQRSPLSRTPYQRAAGGWHMFATTRHAVRSLARLKVAGRATYGVLSFGRRGALRARDRNRSAG